MRSIGKIKIKKLKELIKKEAKYFAPLSMNRYQCEESIKSNTPQEYFDTWESAYSEIERIINDELNNIQYGRD